MADSYPARPGEYPRRLPRSHRQTRPRRRGRKLLIILLVVLLVLAGLLFAVDRYAVGFAERTIATRVAQEIGRQGIRSSAPEVGVHGFPFLTQVVAGRYDLVTIGLRDVETPVPNRPEPLRLPRLDVRAHDISAPLEALRGGQGQVVAGTVDGTATIAYDTVVTFIDQPGVSLREEGGRLRVTAPLTFLGQPFTVHGTANVRIDQAEVVLGASDLTIDGLPDIPAARQVVETWARQVSVRFPLPELPFNLRVQQVRPLPEGLAVTATAADVPLS